VLFYGLIFDMDGVLADTEALSVEATQAMFREMYDVEPPQEYFTPFVGKGAVRYVEGPAERLGVEIDTKAAVRRRTELFMDLLKSGRRIDFPGVQDLVGQALDAGDWRVAIATSSPEDKARATLKAARLDVNRFDAFVNGDMVAEKKPHPEIYLKAAGAIGLDPSRCVGVEDAPPGVEALKAAGIPCVGVVTSFSAAELTNCDLVVDSLKQLELARLKELIDS
jgi:beta-phosphoglucomutase-like phosphatase (HAD superfamily)